MSTTSSSSSSTDTNSSNMMRVLLLVPLLLTGVRCEREAVFVYSRLGGGALLPCSINESSPNCSTVIWTFYKGGRVRYTEEVIAGKVREDSDKSSRMSVTSNCSIALRGLIFEDAGSYVCRLRGNPVTDVYLSLLTITSPSSITELQPGGNLSLSCVLFTYYDVGSCKAGSSTFNLSWTAEDGTTLPKDSRYEQVVRTGCKLTLVANLRREDNNRRWRCQVNTPGDSRAAFQDFTSTFLFQDPLTAQISTTTDCQVDLPVSRIVLCVALPAMVLIVGFFTWREDRKRAKTPAAGIELKEIY